MNSKMCVVLVQIHRASNRLLCLSLYFYSYDAYSILCPPYLFIWHIFIIFHLRNCWEMYPGPRQRRIAYIAHTLRLMLLQCTKVEWASSTRITTLFTEQFSNIPSQQCVLPAALSELSNTRIPSVCVKYMLDMYIHINFKCFMTKLLWSSTAIESDTFVSTIWMYVCACALLLLLRLCHIVWGSGFSGKRCVCGEHASYEIFPKRTHEGQSSIEKGIQLNANAIGVSCEKLTQALFISHISLHQISFSVSFVQPFSFFSLCSCWSAHQHRCRCSGIHRWRRMPATNLIKRILSRNFNNKMWSMYIL